MLNRRTLRIKAFQTLFAYRQSKEANYNIAIENIAQRFAPDLNSMEEQIPEVLKAKKTEAQKIFKAEYKNPSYDCIIGSGDDINECVNNQIRLYHQQLGKDARYFKKDMVNKVEKLRDFSIFALYLLVELRKQAESDTRRNHSNFVKNLLISGLSSNKSFENAYLRSELKWDPFQQEIREWFKNILRKDEEYLKFLALENPSIKDQREILLYIVKSIIFGNEIIQDFMEEMDIQWIEDKPIVKSLATKTIKTISENPEEQFDLPEISYHWEEDKEFFVDLYENSLLIEGEYTDLISKNAKNWDIDRLAISDRIILEMAIAELLNFTSIPIKVTINEYIELSKKYSTPKSKTFVNGMLDAISEILSNEGKIKKSGRGLIDNK
ncbi:MAG: transcription antitermination factor NusB [Cyclobacteriaceae bacterium]|nr:transcription antitermination factor NusB [Cyclobacteriaceae bacterium]